MLLSSKIRILIPIYLIGLILLVSCSSNTTQTPPVAPLASQTPVPLPMPSGTGGGVISFVTDRNGGRMDLYIINADGSELTQITYSRGDGIAPSWSPDGSKLAYLESKNNRLNLYTLDLMVALADPETDHSVLLLADSVDSSPPSWSPDGSAIVFSASQGENLDLYKINLDGSELTPLTQTNYNEKHPAISPDGSKLVFSSNQAGTYDLFLVEILNLADFQIQDPIQITSGLKDELFPAWSPNSEQILYTTTENGNKDLVIISWDGSNTYQLTDSPADEWKGSWSPDGKQIIYSFFNFDIALNDLYIINLENNSSTPITADNFDNWWPSWQP